MRLIYEKTKLRKTLRLVYQVIQQRLFVCIRSQLVRRRSTGICCLCSFSQGLDQNGLDELVDNLPVRFDLVLPKLGQGPAGAIIRTIQSLTQTFQNSTGEFI